MKSIFSDSLTFRNLRINRIHISKLFQGHMETTIEESDILDSGELRETGSNDKEGRIIVSISVSLHNNQMQRILGIVCVERFERDLRIRLG